ncbi:MAG TPA: 6-hydroxymethylpterin diphosphokinase MptE-like protein [Tepidisphaeraceae bacterium]|jgi:hypothetical protein|nr:6-hydroxymethylpterin diphosphokinase MptE-like protein [Tepidisphaeraceae bacterium]
MTAIADPSFAHVLPADAPYLANLAALWATDPKLAASIEAAGDIGVRVDLAKSGEPTLAVESTTGQRIYLHSRYQPLAEAKRLAEAVDVNERLVFYCYGFGLGYHIEHLFDRAGDDAILCIFEPRLAVLRAAFEQRDLSKLLISRRLMFFTTGDKADLFTRLNDRMALVNVGTAVLEHSPSVQSSPDFFASYQQWVDEFASLCRTSITTLLLNGRRTAENIARNLGWYAAVPGVNALKDRYKCKPAIIVSAGPSLRKNKHLLPQAAGQAVLIAAQTTLKPLLEIGVEPNFVTSLDYSDICTRFFEGLPDKLTTELVAEPKATNKIFQMHPGPVSLLGNDFADKLLREMTLDRARLPAGATVAHLAFYLAEHLGCDPIIFVGQDLGFSDGLSYVPGTGHDDAARPEYGRFYTPEMKQWEQIVRDRHILRRIPDVHGRPMYTEERLYAYLQQFERDFGASRSRVIDASEGGALKRGATVMPLAEALREFCTTPLDAIAREPAPPQWDRLQQCIDSLNNRRDEARQIQEISRDTLPLLREVKDHLDDQPRVNRAIAAIDVLRAKMNGLGHCYDLIMQMTQLTEMQRFQADLRISASKLSGTERQRRQVERDIDNCCAVRDAAGAFQAMMETIVTELTAQGAHRSEAA